MNSFDTPSQSSNRSLQYANQFESTFSRIFSKEKPDRKEVDWLFPFQQRQQFTDFGLRLNVKRCLTKRGFIGQQVAGRASIECNTKKEKEKGIVFHIHFIAVLIAFEVCVCVFRKTESCWG